MNKKALTLMELMIVVVIIGILATVAIVNMSGSRERAFDKEAQANLKMIAAGEKMFRLETNAYIACADVVAINRDLRLSIPTGTSNWNYDVPNAGASFCARAVRTSGTIRTWSIRQNQDEPVLGGCP